MLANGLSSLSALLNGGTWMFVGVELLFASCSAAPLCLQAMFKSTVQLVLLPTLLGLLANELFKKQVGQGGGACQQPS